MNHDTADVLLPQPNRRLYELDVEVGPKNRSLQAQPPVLSEVARAYAKKVRGDRKLAVKFLKEAGIIEKPGVLARPYR